MEIKTTKKIVEDSFKNQEFNQKEKYKDITTVFDTLEWIKENNTKWVRVDDIYKELVTIIRATDDERPQEIEWRIRNLAKKIKELSHSYQGNHLSTEVKVDGITPIGRTDHEISRSRSSQKGDGNSPNNSQSSPSMKSKSTLPEEDRKVVYQEEGRDTFIHYCEDSDVGCPCGANVCEMSTSMTWSIVTCPECLKYKED